MSLKEQLEAIWNNHKKNVLSSQNDAMEAFKNRIQVGSVVLFYKSKMVVMNYTENSAILYQQRNNSSKEYNIKELTENISEVLGTVSEEWLTDMNLIR